MIIKANYIEMSNTSNKLKEQKDLLNEEVDNLLDLLEKVKENWEGTDRDIFVGKAEAYFKNIKQISGSIDNFATFMKHSGDSYEEKDINWKNSVDKVGDNFGSEELKLEDE